MKLPNYCDAKERNKNKIETKRYVFDTKYENLGNGKKYYIKTYGCQMNEHDSENIKALLEQIGFSEIDILEQADLVILNTCAIRENAHNKMYGFLGRIKHLKETKNIITCICGCMAQEENVVKSILNKYKWVDIVFGTHNIHELPTILFNYMTTNKMQIEVYSMEGSIIEDMPVKKDSKYKAWVNIMYGCDKFCTYCIVPYTRGKQRSRNHIDILNEVKDLKENGYKEVTLLGQNVNAYGKDLDTNYDMADLLSDVAKINIERIRFVTSHPWDFTDKMIDVISNNDNIMPYIHLPIQSGSDRILRMMGRRYTKDEYLTLYNKLKEKIPNVSITTDIIVGFPSETDEDFNETLDIVDKCKFDGAFTFIFSPRENTIASTLKDTITKEEKEKRLYKLNELVNKYSKMNNDKYLNKVVKVLIEGVSDKKNNMLMGYTDTMKLVNVKGSIDNIGKIVNVKINDVKTWSMDGEKID